ncbi:MAG: hypothetical protein PHF00_04635 [Elusimicrobia bacterium]|nr:hypothetical protein [Elusimicrobiota bacterium]
MLIHVLITAVVVAVIAAGLMRMLMSRGAMINRARESTEGLKRDDGAFGRVLARWNEAGKTCVDGVAGYERTSGVDDICQCAYSPTTKPNDPDIAARFVDSKCQLTIVADPTRP